MVSFHCRFATDQGFDQFGSFFGQVSIGNGDNKDVFELNLPGVRMSRHLNEKIAKSPSKELSLMGACKDGMIVLLSGREIENELRY